MRRSKALRLRRFIENVADHLEDAEALEAVELFRGWSSGTQYFAGQRVRYGGVLYRCLQGHEAQEGWNPADAPSLWARVLIQEGDALPEWVQPDSTNAYRKGDRVMHHGKIWVSLYDSNVWEPGVYGWEEIE